MTKITRFIPVSLIAIAGVASAQTTTPGVPTTAVGGIAGQTLLLILFAIALIALASIIAYRSRGKNM